MFRNVVINDVLKLFICMLVVVIPLFLFFSCKPVTLPPGTGQVPAKPDFRSNMLTSMVEVIEDQADKKQWYATEDITSLKNTKLKSLGMFVKKETLQKSENYFIDVVTTSENVIFRLEKNVLDMNEKTELYQIKAHGRVFVCDIKSDSCAIVII